VKDVTELEDQLLEEGAPADEHSDPADNESTTRGRAQ